MGHKEDQARLKAYKLEYPEEYARKVAEILYRKEHESDVLEQEGYLVGCRSWNIILTVEGLRLSSSSATWPTYEKLVANCLNNRTHVVPDKECTCGIHAMKMGNSIPLVGSIQGRVKLWGRFVEGIQGYRAKFAYPEKFESFVCHVCGKVFEEWGEAYGSTSEVLIVKFRCVTCCNEKASMESKYSPRFFSGADVLQDLNEAYGLIRSWDEMLLNLDLEG